MRPDPPRSPRHRTQQAPSNSWLYGRAIDVEERKGAPTRNTAIILSFAGASIAIEKARIRFGNDARYHNNDAAPIADINPAPTPAASTTVRRTSPDSRLRTAPDGSGRDDESPVT